MAWGSKSQSGSSTISNLIPLVIAFAFLGGVAWVCYEIYVAATKIKQTASQKMGKKNVVFTKGGVKVGVKHVENEKYVDATQSWVVKAWNLSGVAAPEPKKLQKRK